MRRRCSAGSVPKNYFPAVEKGLRQASQHGVLAGYPVVGMKATLLDGSYPSGGLQRNGLQSSWQPSWPTRQHVPEGRPRPAGAGGRPESPCAV